MESHPAEDQPQDESERSTERLYPELTEEQQQQLVEEFLYLVGVGAVKLPGEA